MGKLTYRFGVGDDGGRSSVWMMVGSSNKSDVYVGVRSITGSLKVSLHDSGVCQFGLTKAYAERKGIPLEARIWDRWRAPEISTGVWYPLEVVVPFSSLSREMSDSHAIGRDVDWIPPDRTKQAVSISIMITRRTFVRGMWPGKTSPATTPVIAHPLPNGSMVWLLYHAFDFGHQFIKRLTNAKHRLSTSMGADAISHVANSPHLRATLLTTRSWGTRTLVEVAGTEFTRVGDQRLRHRTEAEQDVS